MMLLCLRASLRRLRAPEFAGDDCVLLAFDEVVAPAARRFAPDIILVSAGFDAHWRDPFEALQFKYDDCADTADAGHPRNSLDSHLSPPPPLP